MNTLNRALTANFFMSLLSGLILIIFQVQVAQIFGIMPNQVFPIIGTGLLFFALTIAVEIKKQRALAILWISIQDALWVLASVVVLIWQPWAISATGYWIIDGVAMIILLFFILQIRGLSKMDSRNGAKLIQFSRVVNAPVSVVWPLITDLENYHQVAPNLDAVKVLSAQTRGEGVVRSCSHGQNSWQETCTLWEEEKMYRFEVDTSAPDYPFPFARLQGTWEVEAISPNQTRVLMEFEVVYKKKIQNVLMHPIAKWKYNKVGEELLDNWQELSEK